MSDLRRTLTLVCSYSLCLAIDHVLTVHYFTDDHGHGHHPAPEEPKTFADYVKPEYWYR